MGELPAWRRRDQLMAAAATARAASAADVRRATRPRERLDSRRRFGPFPLLDVGVVALCGARGGGSGDGRPLECIAACSRSACTVAAGGGGGAWEGGGGLFFKPGQQAGAWRLGRRGGRGRTRRRKGAMSAALGR